MQKFVRALAEFKGKFIVTTGKRQNQASDGRDYMRVCLKSSFGLTISVAQSAGVLVVAPCLLLSLVSCQTRSSPPTSEIRFAHAAPISLLSTPIGRLKLQSSRIQHEFGRGVSVCIRKYGFNLYSDQSLLLETKLAYVKWIKAMGLGKNEYASFSFAISDNCEANGSSLVILEHPKLEPSVSLRGEDRFNEPKISCRPVDAGRYSCSSNGSIVLGWGTSGSIEYSHLVDNPQKWISVRPTHPSVVKLSPFVDWQSLDVGLKTSPNLSDVQKEEFVQTYNALLSAQPEPSFDQLQQFASKLSAAKVILGRDQTFREIMNRGMAERTVIENQGYRLRQAAFRTLLHEVGHTFGLNHADNPSQADITGPSSTTTFDEERKQYVTKEATMAYGDAYGYLTEDDQRGAEAILQAIKSEITSHE